MQILLPQGLTLPPEDALAPRRLQPVRPATIPAYPPTQLGALFSPDRSVGPDTAGSPYEARVIGLMGVGRERSVLIKGPDGRSRALRAGQKLGDWTLVAISSNAATFAGQGKPVRLELGADALRTARSSDQTAAAKDQDQ